MTTIPDYNPSLMDIESIRLILSYYDHTGMLLRDSFNFPTDKHLFAKVWSIKEDPQLGDAFIHYAYGLDRSLKSEKLLNWYQREKEALMEKMNWSTYDHHSKEAQHLVLLYSQHKKTIKTKWATWFKETKKAEGNSIGTRSQRSVTFLQGA